MLRNPLARAGLAAALAASMLIGSAVTASAAGPDGAYTRFSLGGGAGGLVVLSYSGATTVNGGVVGLLASAEYFLHGSSQGCGTQPGPGNRVFRQRGMTSAEGVFWLRRSPSIAATVHSLWLGPTDGSTPPVCAAMFNYTDIPIAAVNGDGAVAIWDKEHVLSLIERRPNNRARLSIVIDLGAGNDTATVRGVDRRCGRKPTQIIFSRHLMAVDIGAYESRVVNMTPAQLGAVRSMRLLTSLDVTACAGIIAILIG